MKKILLSLLCIISFCTLGVCANEIEDDYLDIATNYCIMGDYNNAMQYLDKILTINPNNHHAQDLKNGLSHVISGDKKSFLDNLAPSIKQAMEYKRTGDEVQELNTLIQASSGQNSYLAYYYLGNFYRSKKDYKKALDAFNSSSSARSDYAPAYLSSAIVLYDMGDYNAAINPIDKYLTFNPDDDLAYAVKSRIEFALGMLEQSEQDNDTAIKINNCPEYQFDKAKILYKRGDYQASKNLFESLLNDIQTSKIYEYMGLCDYALQDYKSALTNFDRAILLSNDDEYLESKYNEIKNILETQQNETSNQTQENK